MNRLERRVVLVGCWLAAFLLYINGLNRVGMLGPDEPRYAAIGREMAHSGDWITPRLWGQPWFEKPPLLYWMTALGFGTGLDQDLAPRLPIAIASVLFLIFFFRRMRRDFGLEPAVYAVTVLGTSAGWLACSHVSVPDLPLAVCFSTAMLTALDGPVALSGIFLGLAILAKGPLALALFVPALWFLRRQWRRLALILGIAFLVSAPWYAAMIGRFDGAFVNEFFWKHNWQRFTSPQLEHVRPFWFFAPVLLAGLFPWSPLIALLFQRRVWDSAHKWFFLAWFAWGFVFLSASRNKLPGYLLPLLPAVAALIGITLPTAPRSAAILIGISGALVWTIAILAPALPIALTKGLSVASLSLTWPLALMMLVFGIFCGALAWYHRRGFAFGAVAAIILAFVIGMTERTFPILDSAVSARGAWVNFPSQRNLCIGNVSRDRRYGMDYYANEELPPCPGIAPSP